MPCHMVLVTLLAAGGAWAATSLTTQAPLSAPTGSPTSAPAASTVSMTMNTKTITNRTPVQVTISGVNGPTEAGETPSVFSCNTLQTCNEYAECSHPQVALLFAVSEVYMPHHV